MKQFTPEQKHEILLEYQPRAHSHNFAALSARHAIAGGGRVVQQWFARWNRTAASLQHKAASGRPRILSRTEVQHHIADPIRRLNRGARRVSYSTVADAVREETGKSVSNATIRRI